VLPGWIDAHVHLASGFGKDGRFGSSKGTPEEMAYQEASNAWVTLLAGFTRIQSVGSPANIPLRDAIAKGLLLGPRILTSAEPLTGMRKNRNARRNSILCSQAEGGRRGPYQNLRVRRHAAGRHDPLSRATERSLR
jgi:imidazolonepropionase-like amidohydrolase